MGPKNKRGFLQISFAWLFGIIVGAFILFLAIYASTKFIDVQETSLDAQTAKEIGVLLNPLETGFETGKTSSIMLPSETRIHNRCNNEDFFGKQKIRVSQKIFGDWTETNINATFSNKHIFSEGNIEGKEFLVFSKPFEFPFKVADVIYLTPSYKNYCFVGEVPNKIENEISNLKQENLFLEDNCPSSSNEEIVRVCFDSTLDCQIDVNYDGKWVDKNDERLFFYSDALMYGAIFSDEETYECQTKRLIQRGEQLTELYKDKLHLISRENSICNTGLDSELLELENIENSFSESKDFNIQIINLVDKIDERNKRAQECKLW